MCWWGDHYGGMMEDVNGARGFVVHRSKSLQKLRLLWLQADARVGFCLGGVSRNRATVFLCSDVATLRHLKRCA